MKNSRVMQSIKVSALAGLALSLLVPGLRVFPGT